VEYGPGPARFAGATYDFTSHYRGARVFKFFEERQLSPEKLRELNQHQIGLSRAGLDWEPAVKLSAIGGFLAIQTTDVVRRQKALRRKNIWSDYRGDSLRLGPAPYVTEASLIETLDAFLRVG